MRFRKRLRDKETAEDASEQRRFYLWVSLGRFVYKAGACGVLNEGNRENKEEEEERKKKRERCDG